MACFLVPVAEAIVVTVVKRVVEKKELHADEQTGAPEKKNDTPASRLSWSRKLSWLNKMLWGGAGLLAFEHIWHGEVVLWPPFLTAMYNPADVGPMLQEMALFGTSMAVFITAVWVVMVLIADQKAKNALAKTQAEI